MTDDSTPEGTPAAPALGELGNGGLSRTTGRTPRAFHGVPIEVLVSVGRARPMIADLVKLHRDSVLTLDTGISDPVELYVGDRLIARGELQEMDDGSGRLGVRLTEVADMHDGG